MCIRDRGTITAIDEGANGEIIIYVDWAVFSFSGVKSKYILHPDGNIEVNLSLIHILVYVIRCPYAVRNAVAVVDRSHYIINYDTVSYTHLDVYKRQMVKNTREILNTPASYKNN